MEGTLIRYGSKPAHVAFIATARRTCKKVLVAVGGLSCGLMFAPYVEQLASTLPERTGWTVVQLLLSSSHSGWGMGCVEEDAKEIGELLGTLSRSYGCKEVVLLGHSTGCQDAVMYARIYGEDGKGHPLLKGVILQGPVSDREFLKGYMDDVKYEHVMKLSKDMMERGQGEDVAFVFREWNTTVPICARRWLSLADVGGEDDMFSSDFTNEDLAEHLKSLEKIETLVLMSGADECQVPYGIDPAEMGQRLKDAIGSSAQLCVVENGSHDLSDHTGEAVEVIVDFVSRLSQGG